jgi:hypothetical protein
MHPKINFCDRWVGSKFPPPIQYRPFWGQKLGIYLFKNEKELHFRILRQFSKAFLNSMLKCKNKKFYN